MVKKRKENENELVLNEAEVTQIQQDYLKELETKPEFSLLPDPTGELKLSTAQKNFITHYVNFKSVATAAELSGITADEAKQYFVSYPIQCEIRRINRALYHRQFSQQLISVDNIGGYLSSLLTGENVPIADQLKTNEKLRVIELLLRLNEMKSQAVNKPSSLMNINMQIKNLSIATIKQLLTQSANMNDKNKVISTIDDGSLSVEEKAYLQSLPVEELLKIIEDTNKGGKNESK